MLCKEQVLVHKSYTVTKKNPKERPNRRYYRMRRLVHKIIVTKCVVFIDITGRAYKPTRAAKSL